MYGRDMEINDQLNIVDIHYIERQNVFFRGLRDKMTLSGFDLCEKKI